MKSLIIILLLLIPLSLSAAVNSANKAIPRFYSAERTFFDNNELIKYLLGIADFEPSIRLISKNFKENHDKYCAFYLAQIDERLKNYLNNIRSTHDASDEQFVPSLVSPTLRLEIPLYYLFAKYLRTYANTAPNSAIQNREDTNVVALRRNDIAEGRRFIKNVMKAFTAQVFGRYNPNSPEYLLYLYILTRSCFNPSQFNELGFPIKSLLQDAVKGFYPDPYGEEIVRNFNTNSSPVLVHEAFKSGRVDLARIILNKPGTANILATFIDQSSRMTTLHYCASVGAVDLIDKCLEMGAHPLLVDSTRRRPIHYAVLNGHLEATRRLFELDQNILVSSQYSLSPILIACYNGNSDIMKLFLNNPNITLIGNPWLSNELAEITINSVDASMALVLLKSGKLELFEQISDRLFLLILNLE